MYITYISLQTYLDCFVITKPSESSVISLIFVCEESTERGLNCLAHPRVVCANQETEEKQAMSSTRKK